MSSCARRMSARFDSIVARVRGSRVTRRSRKERSKLARAAMYAGSRGSLKLSEVDCAVVEPRDGAGGECKTTQTSEPARHATATEAAIAKRLLLCGARAISRAMPGHSTL